MNRLLGEYINSGIQGAVSHASDEYAKDLTRFTDGMYGTDFVVKVTRIQDSPISRERERSRIVRMLDVYETLKQREVPHILPLVHWIMFSGPNEGIDSFTNKISDIRELRTCYALVTAYPLLEGTLTDEIKNMNASQRKDVCFQMINIVHSLHQVGVTHEDLHLNNLMYRKTSSGNYYVFAIDFDLANTENLLSEDYLRVCNNITMIMYGKSLYRCQQIKTKPKLFALMKVIADVSSSIHKKKAFGILDKALKQTEFDDSELYYGSFDETTGNSESYEEDSETE